MPGAAGLPSRMRLSGSAAFQEVYASRTREDLGWVVIHARHNGLAFSRLGLSVGSRVGNAVRRTREKRLFREAFRLERTSLPTGVDLVISARPHEGRTLAQCRSALVETVARLNARLAAPGRRQSRPKGGTEQSGGS